MKHIKISPQRYRWVIVAASFLMVFVCLGFCSSSKSLYLAAITEALGIKRSLFSINDSCRYIATAVVNLFFGALCARFGRKRLIAAGFACLIASMLLYAYAPNIYLKNLIDKRRQSIVAAFPDSLDLLLICVESGMSIEAAIQKVSQEVGGPSIEMAEELSLLSAELSYLTDRRMAYEGMAKRTQHPGIRAVATAMTQAETYGTPLGSALRVMAKENRDLRLSAAEKKAAALPAKLTVPMILFFLPVLFVVILGPAIINIQDMMKGG